MKIYPKSVAILSANIIIGSAIAQPKNQQYKYNQDEVTEVYLKNAYKTGGPRSYKSIRGYVPSNNAEKIPLYIRLAGTFDKIPWSEDVQIQTKDMAMRGFAALSVEYDNTVYPLVGCKAFYDKAYSTYSDDPTSGSAASVLCDNMSDDETIKAQVEELNIDCSMGIVTEGFSQGANLASLARNYNSNVKGAFLIGDVEPQKKGCYDIEDLDLPQNRIRSFMGLDDLFGNDPSIDMTPQYVLQQTTGYTIANGDCESDEPVHNCLQEDGSGWYVVLPRDMDTDTADHCYFWPEYQNDCCLAKTNPDYNEHPFNDNFYCEDDASSSCPSQNKVYAMLPSHQWLADTIIETSNSRSLLRDTEKTEQVESSSGTPDRDLTGLFASTDEEEDSCNLCGGKDDMIMTIKASQIMIDHVNGMTHSDQNPGGIFRGYLGQYNSCKQFEDALALSEAKINKHQCLKLRKELILSMVVHGSASTCNVSCEPGKQFSSNKEVNVDKIASALGLSSSRFDDEEVTCQDLASRIELMTSFVGTQSDECEELQHAASYCCTSGDEGAKSGKRNKSAKTKRG